MTSLNTLTDRECMLVHSLAKFYYSEIGKKDRGADDQVFIVKCYIKAIQNVLNKKEKEL